MYLNSILSIVSALDDTALPPPCPFEEMPYWIQQSKRHLGHVPIAKGEAGWEVVSDADLPVVAAIREMDRRLRAVYWWGQTMGEKPPERTILPTNSHARVEQLERTLYYPNHNSGAVAKFFGLKKRIVDNGHYLMAQWFDVKLLNLHTHSHHVCWWVRTPFAATVWPTLEEVVTLWKALEAEVQGSPKKSDELPQNP